jgi:hypothetical protein
MGGIRLLGHTLVTFGANFLLIKIIKLLWLKWSKFGAKMKENISGVGFYSKISV